MTPPLWQKVKRNQKASWWKWKRKVKKLAWNSTFKNEIMASGPITSWQIDGETMETVTDFIFLGSKIIADGDCSHEIKRRLLLGRKAMTNLDSILKSRDITNKGPSRQSYGFSSSHVWMWKLDHKESWVPKNWCFWTVVLEKTLESTMDCKKTKPFNPKENQSWIFIGRADTEALILQPSELKSQFIGKDPDAGKDWRQEEKDNRGWDGWMPSPTQRTWVWASSRRWWKTGQSGVLQSIRSQGVRHNRGTQQQQLTKLVEEDREVTWASWRSRKSQCMSNSF